MHSPVAFSLDEVSEIVADLRHLEGPLLPILNEVQKRFGHVPEAAVRLIATELNLGRAEVHGVATFYHDYKAEPHGRRVLKLCRAEACQSRGGDRIADAAERVLGLRFGETSTDGQVTLEAVYCLGLCAVGPNALLDDKPVGRLTEARVERLAEEARL